MSRAAIGALTTLVLILGTAAVLLLTNGGEGDQPLESPVPRLDIPRLDGGETFALNELAAAPSPTLLWFWAPWCEICNQEAAKIERLAAEASGTLRVVAIGGRDEAANGPAFVTRHGLRTPTVLFDESMASWTAYGIIGQPGAVLLDRSGQERARWSGPFEPRLAIEAARAL